MELSGDTAKLRLQSCTINPAATPNNGQPPYLVNGPFYAYRFANATVEEVATGGGGNLNNSEQEFFQKSMSTKHALHVSFTNASFDIDENYYLGNGSLGLISGSYASMILYLNGLTDTINTWLSPAMMVLGSSQNVDASGLQPVSFRLESSYWYAVPGMSGNQATILLLLAGFQP